MKSNMGKADRIIRVIIALAIGVVGIYYKSWWGLVAFVPLFTAIVNWCPLYVPFKISTAKKSK
jgi:hypothetical protein